MKFLIGLLTAGRAHGCGVTQIVYWSIRRRARKKIADHGIRRKDSRGTNRVGVALADGDNSAAIELLAHSLVTPYRMQSMGA